MKSLANTAFFRIFANVTRKHQYVQQRLGVTVKVDTHELRKLIRSIILQGCPTGWIVPLSRPRNLGRERFRIYTHNWGWTN